jgi:preprotein translocase subunit SecD
MNRYPIWKYVIIAIMLALGTLYSLPNLFGEAPAVQVSPGKASVKVDTTTLQRVEQALATDGLTANRVQLEGAAPSRCASTAPTISSRPATHSKKR